MKKFHVLLFLRFTVEKAEDFSCCLDVLRGGLVIKINWNFNKKYRSFLFSVVNFIVFGHKTLDDPDPELDLDPDPELYMDSEPHWPKKLYPDPHGPKMLDPDSHWNQYGSTALPSEFTAKDSKLWLWLCRVLGSCGLVFPPLPAMHRSGRLPHQPLQEVRALPW